MKQILEFIKSMQCGFFASRPTVKEALDYAYQVAKATGRQEAAVITAVHVVVNTIGKTLTPELEKVATIQRELVSSLKEAEAFMAGFEDDECQEGITEKLEKIRAAIAAAKGE